ILRPRKRIAQSDRITPSKRASGIKSVRRGSWYQPPYESAFAPHQTPEFGIDAQGSAGGSEPPFWMSSIEIASGVRMKAMWPSRGGRLIVTPASFSFAQVA